MVNLPLIVALGLALVGQVDAAEPAAPSAGGACKDADTGCDGTYVTTTAASITTTAAPDAVTEETPPVTCDEIQCGVNCPEGLATLTDVALPLEDAGLGPSYAAMDCPGIVTALKGAGMAICDVVPDTACSMWSGCTSDPLILAKRCPVTCEICALTPITTSTTTTTAPPTTTTTVAAGNNTNNTTAGNNTNNNNSRMLLDEEVFMFEDDVFGEAPARELGSHLKCQCGNTTAVATGKVERHVVEGKMGFDFSSSRRLEAVDEDFVALSRKLLTVDQVQPHIQVGLQQTVHPDTEVTKCDKQDATDVFHTTYQIPCATAAEAAKATTALGDVAKAGTAFDALKAAVTTSAAGSSVVLVIKGPPTVLEAPQTTKKMVTISTAITTNATTTAETQVSGACPPKAMGVLMGLAVLAAAAN